MILIRNEPHGYGVPGIAAIIPRSAGGDLHYEPDLKRREWS